MTDTTSLAATIDAAWEDRASLSAQTKGKVRDAVEAALAALDSGAQRVAEKYASGQWTVNQWLKKAVLLSFRLNPNRLMGQGAVGAHDKAQPGPWWDKAPTKFQDWTDRDFQQAGFRAVPGAVVRGGAYVAKDAVLMPSFVNIGAYVGEGTMVDTWATVGSCAQIGKHCHLSGGVGIGGVLEPLQANPVIIEDNCFIGARSEVAEGVIVREGSVLGMGVYLGQSTPIINRATGETLYGEVPPYSVIVSGNRPSANPMPGQNWSPSLYCAVIVKQVDAQTRSKTSVNELLPHLMPKNASPSAAAGYSGKSLIDKLGWKEGSKAIVFAPPANYAKLTGDAAITPKKTVPATGGFDFIHLFTPDMTSLAHDLPRLEPRLAAGGMLWVSWPKKTSPLFRDLTEDGIRKVCLPMGLVDVKVCAVDTDWSGLKLYRRKK